MIGWIPSDIVIHHTLQYMKRLDSMEGGKNKWQMLPFRLLRGCWLHFYYNLDNTRISNQILKQYIEQADYAKWDGSYKFRYRIVALNVKNVCLQLLAHLQSEWT